MSDQPTEQLKHAINSFMGAYVDDRRFDGVLDQLRQVRLAVDQLDPTSDHDLAVTHRNPDRPVGNARDGQPGERSRLTAEERRQNKRREPPLKRAARQSKQIFQDHRDTEIHVVVRHER